MIVNNKNTPLTARRTIVNDCKYRHLFGKYKSLEEKMLGMKNAQDRESIEIEGMIKVGRLGFVRRFKRSGLRKKRSM